MLDLPCRVAGIAYIIQQGMLQASTASTLSVFMTARIALQDWAGDDAGPRGQHSGGDQICSGLCGLDPGHHLPAFKLHAMCTGQHVHCLYVSHHCASPAMLSHLLTMVHAGHLLFPACYHDASTCRFGLPYSLCHHLTSLQEKHSRCALMSSKHARVWSVSCLLGQHKCGVVQWFCKA